MTTSHPSPSPLVTAAEALEKGLGALDQLATQLERFSISSEKTLQRSATMLLEAGRLHEQLAGGLAGLRSPVHITGPSGRVEPHSSIPRETGMA